MKLQFLYFFTLFHFLGFAQEKKVENSDIENFVATKERDFNTVFVPLYNERDTVKYNFLLQQSQAKNYPLGKIIALNLKGTYYRDQAQYAKSIELHNEALNIAEKLRITDGRLYSTNMLGVVFRRMDNVQKGLEYHFKALKLAEEQKERTDFVIRNTAIAVNGIGNSYLILQEYNSARKQFVRSLEIESSIGNTLGLAINYQNIGITYEETGKPDSALIYYKKSLQENINIDNNVGKMICYNSIAGTLMRQKNYDEAMQYINQAEQIAIKNGDSFYTTTIYLKKAIALMNMGHRDDAFEYLNKSKEISIQHNLKTNLAETYEALSQWHQDKGEFSEAIEYSRLSKEMQLVYLNENNLRVKNNFEISYDVASKANEILNLEREKELMQKSVDQNRKTILILGLLLGAISLIGFLIYRQSQLKKEKQVLELEQKVLRAQMNPHFTFNALNSIKTYIITQDTEKAVGYLNKFAKMIRGVLYASDRRTNTLQEELEMIESYIEIEKLRFKDPINLKIYNQNVDLQKITIPPLLLQPFVENALWHGLAKKEGEKKIDINILQPKKNKLTIEIIDNGIGRKASLQEQSNKKHDSMGIHISKKRMQNHFNLSDKKRSVEYEDLQDTNGNALGTKVSLSMPILS